MRLQKVIINGIYFEDLILSNSILDQSPLPEEKELKMELLVYDKKVDQLISFVKLKHLKILDI